MQGIERERKKDNVRERKKENKKVKQWRKGGKRKKINI